MKALKGGISIAVRTGYKVMRKTSSVARRKYKATTNSKHNYPVASIYWVRAYVEVPIRFG